MIEACIQIGIKDEDIYLVKHNVLVTGYSEEDDLLVPYRECVQIFDLNVHITDHCNMKCELCCHHSQFVEESVFADYDEFCRDLDRMHELVPDICQLSLLGGEPLLHPKLTMFLAGARKRYPYARIVLVTNGLLLEKSSPELLQSFKDYQIIINISLYPPMHHQLDSLLRFIKEKELNASIHRVDKFFKKFSENPRFNAEEMSVYCGYCMGLRNGKISRCIDSLYVGYFNKKFGDILPDTAGIDIYDTNLTPLQLIHSLEQPMELCKYCAAKYTLVDTFEWKQVSENSVKEDILFSM